jgi:hypothetical protein
MVPIFEQGQGQGIGHSFDSFLKRFTDICEEYLENGRAKSFAFILYDFQDQHVKEILRNQGGFAQLDRLSGSDISVFYLHSDNRRLLKTFNEIFLGAFEITTEYHLPFVLFFNLADREVTKVEIVELGQTNLMFAFKELYDSIENYKARIKDSSVEKTKPKTNKLTEFFDTVKKVSLDKFIEWLIDKGAQKASDYI